MRTGADYREALRDGRKVFVMGEGRVDDVTTHPATRAMVEQYVTWYDRHFDLAWVDTLLTPPDASGNRVPWAFALPKTSADVIAIGRAIQRTILLSAGNITHTPLYGHLIALGVLTAAEARSARPHYAANAMAYRDMIASNGQFLTFCGGAPVIGQRMQPDPIDRVSVKRVSENDKGMVLGGRLGMHTSPCRGCLRRFTDRVGNRRTSGRLHRSGQRPWRHRFVPQGCDPRPRALLLPAFRPVRRT